MCLTHTDALLGDESGESGDDPETVAAEEAAAKERKKAGLPEITVDTVNSTIATKVLNLSKTIPIMYGIKVFYSLFPNHFCAHFGASALHPRTCLTKRVSKLDAGLGRFDDAAKLSNLQQLYFSPIRIVCTILVFVFLCLILLQGGTNDSLIDSLNCQDERKDSDHH